MGEIWEIVDHACKNCAGRLVKRKSGGVTEHRCTNCGETVEGDHLTLCWCGVDVSKHGKVFECFKNPKKSLSMPQEILIREKEQFDIPESQKFRKFVNVEGY
jgi:hypothetical protein